MQIKNQALGSGRPERRDGLSLGLDLESDDGDLESQIGAPFPANRPPNFEQSDSSLQVGVDNVGNGVDDRHQNGLESVGEEDDDGNGNGDNDQERYWG